MKCKKCEGLGFLNIGKGTVSSRCGFYMHQVPCDVCRCVICLKLKDGCLCSKEVMEGAMLFIS